MSDSSKCFQLGPFSTRNTLTTPDPMFLVDSSSIFSWEPGGFGACVVTNACSSDHKTVESVGGSLQCANVPGHQTGTAVEGACEMQMAVCRSGV